MITDILDITALLTEDDVMKIGCFLANEKQNDKALAFFMEAHRRNPENVNALLNIGSAIVSMKKPEEARPWLVQAVQKGPTNAAALLNYGTCLQLCQDVDAGKEHLLRALDLNPPFAADVWGALAMNSQYRGNIPQAIVEYQQSLSLAPDNQIYQMCLSMMYMLAGDWDRGLPLYESRAIITKPGVTNEIPAWRPGVKFDGKKILLVSEQGVGDTIMFSRFFKHLKTVCPTSRFCFLTSDSLAELSALWDIEVIPSAHGAVPMCDYQIPIMSVMLYLHENKLPFIIPPEQPAGIRIHPTDEIGFCWRGNPSHAHDRFRSMNIGQITKISKHFHNTVCLQYDATAEERMHFDFNPCLSSWMETAQIVSKLGAVVTVDTAIAHMAATLGVPTYMLSALPGDWRWGLEGMTTPWYPSLRIYRQTKLGEWGPMIESIVKDLREKF